MTEGEGFQIVIWDVINKKKAEKATKKGEYINSGQVILKAINLEQVDTIRQALINLNWYLICTKTLDKFEY